MHAIKIPGAPDNWSHPAAKTEQGEPSFENVDNPGGWSSFTFRSEYEKGQLCKKPGMSTKTYGSHTRRELETLRSEKPASNCSLDYILISGES